MKEFELKDPKIMGEEHPQYGFTFWSLTDGDYPVMFNSKQGNIMPGTRIQAETAELKTSKNGKDYLRLKKVTFEDEPHPQKPFEAKPAATFKNADKPFFRDASTIPLDVWRTLIGIQGVPETESGFTAFFETVRTHAEELMTMIENVRNSGQAADPTPSVSVKEEHSNVTAAVPIKQKLAESDWTDGEPV